MNMSEEAIEEAKRIAKQKETTIQTNEFMTFLSLKTCTELYEGFKEKGFSEDQSFELTKLCISLRP